MKCPECQFDNREVAKFCISCGAKLEINCSKCSHLNPPASKFCEECGFELNLLPQRAPQELSFDEKISKIQKYLPEGLTEKIISQKDRIEGERKHVTVMFCDLQNFTSLSEILGPENAYTIMDQVYEILIRKVHDYEGTVNEMTGDGVMALFGAPIALEDAPQRAILSAQAIHKEMTNLSDKIIQEKEGIPPLKMRIGIHTGPVVVGTLGNDLRLEFKAVGDTVNLASRIENMAEPGTTYVTYETFRLSEGFFRFEALGQKKIKGKEGTIKTYRVVAPSIRRTKFDVAAERGLTPFVGRERELELLLDGFERVKAGCGQAFSIIAEAGLGKSRLLCEFRKTVANEDVTFLEGKCLSYSRGVAYHPVIDILKSNFYIDENDGDISIREKVLKGLKILGIDETSVLPYLLELLLIKDSGIDQIPLMSPEAIKDRIMAALRIIVLKGSELKPLIMVFEDLHWIDKSSEYYLKDILDYISGAKVFLIFTYRPEYVQTWSAKSYHSQVNLIRLSNRENLAIVSHLLGTEEIDTRLEELILEKTEGFPFFIEEFIKSLKDLKLIEKKKNTYYLKRDLQELTIPSTIQDVIMARVDLLHDGAKEVLQIGSAIEREFRYSLIKKVSDLPQKELLSRLSELKDAEFVFERGIYPDSTYIFKHALIQEVIYDGMLTQRKKQLHNKIGQAIEQLYKDNLHDYCALLAEHFINGGDYERGAEYSRMAARRAEKAGSFNDAVAYAKKRVASLEKLPQIDDVIRQIIDARTTLGLYLFQNFYMIKAKEAVDPIIELAAERGNKKRLSQIYVILGAQSFAQDDFSKALEYYEKALRFSEEANDSISSIFSHYCLGTWGIVNCEFEKANYHLEKALEINVSLNALWGISVVKGSLSDLYSFQGKINLGFQTSDDAIRIAEKCGDIHSKARAYIQHGISCFYKGFQQEASNYLLKGLDLCYKINLFQVSGIAHVFLGNIHFNTKQFQKSKNHYEKASIILKTETYTSSSMLNLLKIYAEMAKLVNKENDIDLESLYGYVHKNKIRRNEGLISGCMGKILIHIDDQHMYEAEDFIQKAIEADARNGMRWHLGCDYALYAEFFKRKGDLSKAGENLSKAIETLKECGAEGWVKKYEEELATLS